MGNEQSSAAGGGPVRVPGPAQNGPDWARNAAEQLHSAS